jgi:hypothetical protein
MAHSAVRYCSLLIPPTEGKNPRLGLLCGGSSHLLIRVLGVFLLTMVASALSGQETNPVITSVSPVTDQGSPTIIIDGSNFGTLPSADLSSARDTRFLMITGPLLCVGSTCTDTWNAGYIGDACKLTIGSWTNSQIVINGTGIGGSTVCPLFPGNDLTVRVWNPALPSGPPAIAQAQVINQGLVPTVSSVTPNYGPQSGGNTVTISGTGFTGATAVWFGPYLASTYTVESDSSIVATAPKARVAQGIQLSVASPTGTWQPPVDCVLQTGAGCVGPYFFMTGIFAPVSKTIPINVTCSEGSSGFSCTSNGLTFGIEPPTGPNLACLGDPQSPNFDFNVTITGSATIQTDGDFGFSGNFGLPTAFIDSGNVTLKSLQLAVNAGGSISETYQLPIPLEPVLTPCVDDLYLIFSGSVYDGGSFTISAKNLSINTKASWIDGQDAIGVPPTITCSGVPITLSNVNKCVNLQSNMQPGLNLDYIQELRFQVGSDDLNASVGLKLGVSAGDDPNLNPSPLYVDACTDVAWQATAAIPPISVSYGAPLIGPYNIYASEPDASLDCALGAVLPQTTTTTTTLASSANPSVAANEVTFTAKVSPIPDGGTVGFTDNGGTMSGCGANPLSAGNAACSVTYSTAGSHSIVATYSGDPNYLSSTSRTLTEVVTAPGQTVTMVASSANPSLAGSAVTFTATVSPTPNGGTVAFTDNSGTISGCGANPLSGSKATCTATYSSAGSHSIVATYSGDSNYLTSTSHTLTQVVTIAAIPTSTTVASSVNPSVAGSAVTFTATISPTPNGGTVAFTDNSGTISACGANPLSGSKAKCTVTYSSAGSHSIVATYSGDSNYLTSTSHTLTQLVNAALAITPTLPTATVGTAYSGAVGISGGTLPYTFSWSGSLPPGLSFFSPPTLSGTPQTGGVYSFPVSVSDSSNPVQNVTQTISITVEPTSALAVITTSLPNGQLGTPYSASVEAAGGCPPYTWSATQLPAGLTLNANSGAISGTPSASGLFDFTITVTDTCHSLAASGYNISISNPTAVGSGTLTTQFTPNGSLLVAISCIPNSSQVSCWAVGSASGAPIILYSADAGQTWSSETPPSGVSGLYSINCPALNVCYAGTGTKGSVVIMTTDGINWTALTTPSGSPGGGSISCPSTSTCFVTGGDSLGANQEIMYTTDSGSDWTVIHTCAFCGGVTGSTEFQEQGISCPTASICYSSGIATISGVGSAAVLSTTDGGTTWVVTTLAGPNQLLDINCTSSTQCWVVGQPGSVPYDYPYVASTTDGTDWQAYGTPVTGYSSGGLLIGGIACVNASTCMVTGALVTQAYSTNNGGTGWLTYALPSGAGSLAGTSCVSSGECWLVTQNGGIFATLVSPQ